MSKKVIEFQLEQKNDVVSFYFDYKGNELAYKLLEKSFGNDLTDETSYCVNLYDFNPSDFSYFISKYEIVSGELSVPKIELWLKLLNTEGIDKFDTDGVLSLIEDEDEDEDDFVLSEDDLPEDERYEDLMVSIGLNIRQDDKYKY